MRQAYQVEFVLEIEEGDAPLSVEEVERVLVEDGFQISSISMSPVEGAGAEEVGLLSSIPDREAPVPRDDGRRRWVLREGRLEQEAWGSTPEDAFESIYPPSEFRVTGRYMSRVGGRERYGFTSRDGRRVLMAEVHGRPVDGC